jgi:hypothetical protein
LERLTERGGMGCGLVGAGCAQDREQLQTDDFGRTVDIGVECGAVGIVAHRQIHPHRGEEGVEQGRWNAIAIGGVENRGKHGVGVGITIAEAHSECVQLPGPFGGFATRVELIEDVVGSARESVQGVHCRALIGREQSGRQEEGLSVACVQLSTVPVGPVQSRAADSGSGAVRVISAPITVIDQFGWC